MYIVSVNVAQPTWVDWEGQKIQTSIFKQPVAGRIRLHGDHLHGDQQADLRFHGGPDKAVYGYPSEHYRYWQTQFPDKEMPWGMFGENLTLAGLLETAISVGDRFSMGTTELMAVQPRVPCYKLGIRFDNMAIVPQFQAAQRPGIYFRILREGELGVNDVLKPLEQRPDGITIAEIYRLLTQEKNHRELLERALREPLLPEPLKHMFQKRLAGHS